MFRLGKRHFCLSDRLTVIFALTVAFMAALAGAVAAAFPSPLIVSLTTLAAGLTVGVWLLRRFLRPAQQSLRALLDGIQGLRDRDYSLRLAVKRQDELGELLAAYNDVGDLMRQERSAIYQKELLLDTVLQSTPTAIVLSNSRDRIIFANRAARRLFSAGRKLEGHSFKDIAQSCPREVREALDNEADALFTFESEGEQETYHISKRSFHLNHQRHSLYMVGRLTRELSRQEAEVWKKVIRVISHELNNSLAPISSMVHSAKALAAKHHDKTFNRLNQVLDFITERTDYLKAFLEGYARFARLPKPRKAAVCWQDFIEQLRQLYPFVVEGELPRGEGYFDPSQMQQVLINLLKNAVEASHDHSEVKVKIESTPDAGTYVLVMDRGKGMDEDVLKHCLLPFYSTKQSGSGLGLPLCREIVEAHGGQIRIERREGGGTTVVCHLPRC